MNRDNKGTFWQAIATIAVWVMVTGGVALGGVFLAGPLGEDALGFFFMLFAAAVISMGFIWDWGRIPGDRRRSRRRNQLEEEIYETGYEEKRKRDRLGQALRQLSEDELVRLRDRIASGDVEEEELEYILRDDPHSH